MPDVSIIIGIDKPREDLCFVITPYRLPLERLIDAVVSVAAEKHLTPILNRTFATKKDWTADIRDCIRRAKIVIALGCVDAATRRSRVVHRVSENVMYELGLAHALAKPTLVVWDRKVALPADIRNYRDTFLFKFDTLVGADVAAFELFKSQLRNYIDAILQRVAGNIIDHLWGDIFTATGRACIFYDPLFISRYQSLIAIGCDIRDKIDTLYISSIRSLAEAAAVDPPPPDFSAFLTGAYNYPEIASRLIDPVLGSVADYKVTAMSSLELLEDTRAHISDRHKQNLRTHCDNMLNSLDQFKQYHEQFVRTVCEIQSFSPTECLDSRSIYNTMSRGISQLRQASGNVISNATKLLLSLCEMNRSDGESRGL